MIERDGEQRKHPSGVWGGVIRFRLRWAHPVWCDYVVSACDLNSPSPTGKPAFKINPAATHEFLLYACDPSKPIDFENTSPMQVKKGQYLQPPNHGYQFTAESDAAAWARLNGLIDDCMAARLSPDTDWRSEWDRRISDGWTLLRERGENGVVSGGSPNVGNP